MSKPTADQIRNAKPLAQRFIDAYQSDIDGDGCDIQAGLFGPALSALIVELDELCTPSQPAEGGTWEENVKHMLDNCPYTVRDLSGEMTGERGKEYLIGSLSITFLSMMHKLKGLGVKK